MTPNEILKGIAAYHEEQAEIIAAIEKHGGRLTDDEFDVEFRGPRCRIWPYKRGSFLLGGLNHGDLPKYLDLAQLMWSAGILTVTEEGGLVVYSLAKAPQETGGMNQKAVPTPAQQARIDKARKEIAEQEAERKARGEPPNCSRCEQSATLDHMHGFSIIDHKLVCSVCVGKEDYRRMKEAQRGWISVKDRLPEMGENVAVLGTEFLLVIPGIKERTFVNIAARIPLPAGPGWDWDGCGGTINSDVITHWMPLPSPPEQERAK